jgi:hypothetical protein
MLLRLFIPYLLALAAFSPLFALFVYVLTDGLEHRLSGVDYFVLSVFLMTLALALVEEFTDLRKSKPLVLAAGLI